MKLDFESIKTWLIALPIIWKIGGLILLLLIIVLALSSLFDSCGGWWTRRSVEKDKQAVNALKEEANEINAQIVNLQIQENAIKEQINAETANLGEAQNATNNAQVITNQFMDNSNRIRNANIQSNFELSNRIRCNTYPGSPGC